MLLLSFATAAEPASTLEQAYQKEYAYLRAERAELEARLSEIDRDSAARVSAADAELEALQAKLVATSRAADRAEDEFDALERQTNAADDATSLLSNTVQQGSDTLGLPAATDPVAAIPEIFNAANSQLRAANAVGWRDDTFFLPTGEQVTGKIYSFGQVASWGVSAEAAGSLAPAGEGRLQLRRDFGRATATALQANPPANLEIQLYEPERGVEEAEKAGGLGQLLKDAGTMGQVLFGLGCVSATLVLIRAISLAFARRGGDRLVKDVTALIRADKLGDAEALLARRGGPSARILRAIVNGAERSKDELDRLVDEAILKETPGVDRFASALVVITAGSPLLGLLGTVTGMIATFDVITQHGTGNPKLMSAGIAEALVCTALGLSVAIPTLLAGNVLASIGDGIKNTMERGALAALNALERRRHRTAERAASELEALGASK